jgi:hypothetical protein
MFEKIPFTKMQVNGTKVGAALRCINNDVITRHLIIERESYVSARVCRRRFDFFYTLFTSGCVQDRHAPAKLLCVAFFISRIISSDTHSYMCAPRGVKYGALCIRRFLDRLINPAGGWEKKKKVSGCAIPAGAFFPAAAAIIIL